MTYEAAIAKAWEAFDAVASSDLTTVTFLADTYEVRRNERKVVSVSCGTPAKEQLGILILHTIAGSLRGHFSPSGQWISFKEIEGGSFYYSAFREGTISPLLRKYGASPERILDVLGRFRGKRIEGGDAAIELVTFPDVSVRIILWRGDDEVGPEATMLFDRNITKIYPMEDVAVFSRVVVHQL